MKKEFITGLAQLGAFAGFQFLNGGITGVAAAHQYGEAFQGTDSSLATFVTPEALQVFADYAAKGLISIAALSTIPELYFNFRDFKKVFQNENSTEVEKKRAAFNLGYAILKAIVIDGLFAPFIFGIEAGVAQIGAITAALPIVLLFENLMRLASLEMDTNERDQLADAGRDIDTDPEYLYASRKVEIQKMMRNALLIMEPISLLTLTLLWNGGKPYFNDAWLGYIALGTGFVFIGRQLVHLSNATDTFENATNPQTLPVSERDSAATLGQPSASTLGRSLSGALGTAPALTTEQTPLLANGNHNGEVEVVMEGSRRERSLSK